MASFCMPRSSSISESDDSTEGGTSANVPYLSGIGDMDDWTPSMSWVSSVACVLSKEGAYKAADISERNS